MRKLQLNKVIPIPRTASNRLPLESTQMVPYDGANGQDRENCRSKSSFSMEVCESGIVFRCVRIGRVFLEILLWKYPSLLRNGFIRVLSFQRFVSG